MQQTGTIADLKEDVIDALQGRTDITDAQVSKYVARTVREITESQPFTELQATGPQVALTIGQAIYPVAKFTNTEFFYSMPESFTIYIDPPTNSVASQIRYKTPAAIEPLIASAVMGIPTWFTRFDTNFHLGPVPNAAYTVFLRYQSKHPFSPTPALGDPLYIPRSWFDIVAYGTAMRICIPKRWTDQRKELHDMLYGDPEFINSQGKRGRPGLIAAHTFQQERDQANNSRNIGIVVSRVNPR